VDENKRCRVTCENQPARRRGSNKFAADSSLEEDGFERAVPPRRESLRGAAPGKHRRLGPEPVSASAFRAAVSDWQRPEEPSQERDRWFESGSLHRRVSNKPFRRWASMEPRTPQRAFRRSRTDGSNPVPSSGESVANPFAHTLLRRCGLQALRSRLKCQKMSSHSIHFKEKANEYRRNF